MYTITITNTLLKMKPNGDKITNFQRKKHLHSLHKYNIYGMQ